MLEHDTAGLSSTYVRPIYAGAFRDWTGFPTVWPLRGFWELARNRPHQGQAHPVRCRGRHADAQCPAQLWNGKTSLHALDGFKDLAIRKSRLPDAVELLNEKILLLTAWLLRGDYRISYSIENPIYACVRLRLEFELVLPGSLGSIHKAIKKDVTPPQ